MFPASVERWRDLVEQECARPSKPPSWNLPISPNWVLALIKQESGGVPGKKAYRKAGDGSYARGLLQCIKSVTDDYNQRNGTSYDHETVIGGEGDDDARIQIRVGLELLRHKRAQVLAYMKAKGGSLLDVDISQIADTAYAMGWGAARAKLDTMIKEGLELDFQQMALRFAKWGYSESKKNWINQPIHHAKEIRKAYVIEELENPYESGSIGGVDIDEDEDNDQDDDFHKEVSSWSLASLLGVVGALLLIWGATRRE